MTTGTSNPRRRWYQFRLRTLLIVMALCTIPFAFIGSEIRDVLRDRETAAWIVESGGSVHFEKGWLDQWVGGSVQTVGLAVTQVSDLTPLAELKGLQELHLDGTRVSDLTPLAELKELNRLDLDDTQVSEKQLEMLQKALPYCRIHR